MNDQVRHLFHALADLTPGERERVFAERQVSPELRAEVESLLSFDATDGRDLSGCVADVADEVLRATADSAVVSCGPYRLVRMLGAGGMGTVYLGERADGEIQRKVAVKLLRADGHRPGWRDRFLRERQLLASLNHPSIVHVIDAGHTADSRPYLVMEYIEGVPIDVYAGNIELRERLKLFLRVCEGVAHAHRHLIIHRDLKPSNILVDESGQPKLLDFGIAKLLDEAGDSTQTVERLLTPSYASPEQLRGAAQSTATDVYSLGAVLYKLVAGRSPHESETGTSQAVEVMTGTRQIPPPSSLKPEVPADIDHIAGKALRPEPEERYASVDAFAADLRAFLESRPVAARSGNAWYRTRKFLRRYWVPVAAAALVIASLATGLFIANRERIKAERRFSQLRQLSQQIFELDKAIRNLPGSTQARQRLVAASLGYLEGLARDARGDLDLDREIGEGYWRVARVQGVPTELNLGERTKAEASLKKAAEWIETVLAARPNDPVALYRSASIAQDRMILAQEEHRNTDAVAYAHTAAARMDKFFAQSRATDTERHDAAGLFGNIALAYLNMHSYAEAIANAQKSAALIQTIPSSRYRIAQALSLKANAQRYQGDLDGALQSIREARTIAEQAAYSSETQRMLDLYGVFLREGMILGEDGGVNLDRSAEAIESLQKAFDMTEAAARKDPRDAVSRTRLANSGVKLANILRRQDPQRALAAYDAALHRLDEIPKSRTARQTEVLLLANSSYALRALHRPAEARRRIEAAMEILQETKDLPAARIALESPGYTALCAMADDYAAQGDSQRAIATYEELLAKVMAAKPDILNDLRDVPRLSALYESLARAYRQTGAADKADNINARRRELWQQWDRKLPNNAFVRRQLSAAAVP